MARRAESPSLLALTRSKPADYYSCAAQRDGWCEQIITAASPTPPPGPQHLLGFSVCVALIPVRKAGTSGSPGCGVQYLLHLRALILALSSPAATLRPEGLDEGWLLLPFLSLLCGSRGHFCRLDNRVIVPVLLKDSPIGSL